MAKKALTTLLLFFTLMASSASISFVHAQVPPEFPNANQAGESSPWDPTADATAIESYRNAINSDNCMTPSLECLVHQTFRFVAIDFVHSTLYPQEEPSFSRQSAYDPSNPVPVANKNKSFLTGMGTVIGHMYSTPVANTGTYIADVMNSAHITPKAYAQGLGFSALNPVLELWKAFRNIAYMFFIILFIIIGFMIMFRQKIGGQAAITAQQAIPSVIVSLILVTFSYAIAGLMIDLMYVIMFLIIGVFGQTLPSGSDNLIDMSTIQVMGALFRTNDVFNNVDLVSNLFGSLFAVDDVSKALGFLGGLTLTVVLTIAILIGTIKLFFELLKSYASIVLSVVTSPLVLMFGAMPGKNPFVGWIKDLFGNLISFPVVLLVLVLYYQFSNISGAGNEGGFIPPFLIGRGQAGAISSLMGLALILALPEIVKDTKKKFVKEGFGFMVASTAGKALGQGWSGGELIPGQAWSNTNRIPGVGKYLGSGKSVVKSGAVAGSTLGGAAAGAVRGLFRAGRYGETRKDVLERVAQGGRFGGRSVADFTGSEMWKKNREERQKTSVFKDRDKIRKLSDKEGK